MPVEMIWLVPDKILLSRWVGNITAADISIILDEIRLILENADDYIHSLMDLSDLGTIDPDAIYLYAQSALAVHPRRGRIAGVNPTFESEVLADLLNRMTQRELIRMFPTREAARDFLLENDTPPPLLSFGFRPVPAWGRAGIANKICCVSVGEGLALPLRCFLELLVNPSSFCSCRRALKRPGQEKETRKPTKGAVESLVFSALSALPGF